MKVHEKLSSPATWTQGEASRDEYGLAPEFGTAYQHAVCWCLGGALEVCYPDREKLDVAVARVAEAIAGHPVKEHWQWDAIIEWNDDPERTNAEVLDLVKGLDV